MPVKKAINFIFEVQDKNPELNRARYKALTKQIPPMYTIVMVNIMTMAYTHFQYAPYYITILLPIILTPITIIRSIILLRTDINALDDAQIRDRLRTINYLALFIGLICIVWSINLFGYGDAYTQGYVAFFMCLTAIGVITCLMHLQQSAIIIATVVVVPGCIFFGMSEHLVFNALAIDISLVIGLILFIMFRYAADFTNLIENQQKLEIQGKALKILNAENTRLANLDSLTALPNRRCFFFELDEIIRSRLHTKDQFIVGMLDLDGFKQVNDLFGHSVGDELLTETGSRLRELLNEDIFIARLGGDEFGIIIKNPSSEEKTLDLGKTICNTLSAPFDMEEVTAKIAGTLGFASFPSAGETSSVLFERADYALCYSKQNSKGTAVMFSTEHETTIRKVSNVAHHLREADLNQELSVVLQPIIDTDTGHTVCLESLARWDNPTLGRVPPDIFIGSAEKSGMISDLTSILFTKTLNAAEKIPDHIQVSFNLSTFDLCSHEATLKLVDTLKNSNISAKRITFEITETAVMQNFDQAIDALNTFRELGCKIALDDFGTGFSSLSYIQNMPIDRLKIDRSFILDIETNKATRNIVRTIASLCSNLDLEGVVEGVETKEQLDILIGMDLNIIQGYYFSKPLTEKEAIKFIENEKDATDGNITNLEENKENHPYH